LSFSPRLARFVIFARGTQLFNGFQQSARVCTEQKFSARDQHVLSFSHWAQTLLAIFSKVYELTKTAFLARDQHVSSFSHWAHHFLTVFNKVLEIAIFALCAPLLSNFQQSA